jgi:UDP:flavonoid glycosyltransferase YjiC (YdhE family)
MTSTGTTTPGATPRDDLPLHLETEERDGVEATVVRDAAGHIAYPSLIPPDVDFFNEAYYAYGSASAAPGEAGEPAKPAESDEPAAAAAAAVLQRADTEPLPPSQTRPLVEARSGTTALEPPSAPLRRYTQSAEDNYSSDETSESEADDDDTKHKHKHKKHKPHKLVHKHKPAAGGNADADADDDTDDSPFRRFRVGNENYKTRGKVKKDGRLRITLEETANTGYLAKALGSTFLAKAVARKKDRGGDVVGKTGETSAAAASSRSSVTDGGTLPDGGPRLRLNIVIMVIGSRGDAQPFLKIGKILKEDYGHRVRIATHPAFREFVEKDSGLEFFSVGGDPSELMAFMVKNPGMIPTLETVKAGDIGRRRAAMAEMFQGFWRACIDVSDDDGGGRDAKNASPPSKSRKKKTRGARDPFVADAIIANPPSFAHIHCAEALGIPLHLMFTFPYTPTQEFPHPLASIKRSNVDPGYTNFISYPLVEMMVWQGLGDLVNEFRVRTLALDPVSTLWAPGATYRLHVPVNYLWSPGLVPKPEDWGDEVDVSGFVFLDLASTFRPPQGLVDFLDASSERPVYIGFGSIVVDDADRFTDMIFEAVRLAGVRALVSKGWGGLGGETATPDNIYMLENTPHDWLFPRVEACVIHGGAGTTAIALKCGRPTMVVPFFGDQHFWGNMIGSAGAGPMPVPYRSLSAEKLAEGIRACLTDECRAGAARIAADIEAEGDGAANAVTAFHRHLASRGAAAAPGATGSTASMRCSILRDRVAVWTVKGTGVRLSGLAADVLVTRGLVQWKRLRLARHAEWNDFEGPGEPLTGLAESVLSTVGNFFGGIGGVPYRLAKTSRRRRERRGKRAAQREKKKKKEKEKSKLVEEEEGEGGGSAGSGSAGSGTITATPTPGPPTGVTPAAERAEEYFGEVTTGVARSATAIARAPVDLAMALAQG